MVEEKRLRGDTLPSLHEQGNRPLGRSSRSGPSELETFNGRDTEADLRFFHTEKYFLNDKRIKLK